MPLKTMEIPSTLMIGFMGERDFRILNIDEQSILFESDDPVSDGDTLSLAVFNLHQYDYEEYVLRNCPIVLAETREFSFLYRVAIEVKNQPAELWNRVREILEYTNRREQFTRFIQHEIYPSHKDNEYFESYAEQKEFWDQGLVSDAGYQTYAKLVSNVEPAFSMDNYELYHRFLEMGFKNALSSYAVQHGIFTKPFTRVYIGNQFCHNLFPDTTLLFKLLDQAVRENYDITLAFTYMRDCFIDQQTELLQNLGDWAREKSINLEVVLNDWGMIDFVSQKVPGLIPVFGLLLNKRKKDPRMQWKWGANRFTREREENNLNCEHFRDFLSKYQIARFEFEAHHEVNKIPPGKHSLHFPFYQVSTCQYCALYAECANLNRNKTVLAKNCPRYCSDYAFLYPKHLNLIGKGNSLFGYNNNIMVNPDLLQYYIENGIDRLVYSV